MTETLERWAADDKKLRAPFPPERVGKLPKPYQKDAQKGNCGECGKYHGLPALHLDYVGHGAITERLLEVDPDWDWEPLALDGNGLPLITQRGGDLELWIRLTIGGRTKKGVGTCPANQFDASKVLIGDALRNAGMRFGLALDLWIKGDDHPEEERTESKQTKRRTTATEQAPPAAVEAPVEEVSPELWNELYALQAVWPSNEETMAALEKRMRRLYELMELTGLWKGGSLHAALRLKAKVEHVSDLRKEALKDFAVVSWQAAQDVVQKLEASPA